MTKKNLGNQAPPNGGTTTPPLESIINNQTDIMSTTNAMTTRRNQHYATLVYPMESAPPDWIEKLEEQHIQALISPLHDKDIDKEGNPKKPHHHIILIFESLKSPNQVKEIIENFGGVGVIPIHSLGAYSRYLCHLDSSEKAQYNKEDVKEIGGADYNECCRQNNDKEKEDEADLIDLTQIILSEKILYFHEAAYIILTKHRELFGALKRNSYYVHSIVLSLVTQMKNERKEIYLNDCNN